MHKKIITASPHAVQVHRRRATLYVHTVRVMLQHAACSYRRVTWGQPETCIRKNPRSDMHITAYPTGVGLQGHDTS